MEDFDFDTFIDLVPSKDAIDYALSCRTLTNCVDEDGNMIGMLARWRYHLLCINWIHLNKLVIVWTDKEGTKKVIEEARLGHAKFAFFALLSRYQHDILDKLIYPCISREL